MMADVHYSDITPAQEETTSHPHPSDQILIAAHATIPIDKDVLRQAYNKVEDDLERAVDKIHRFPASLRVFCEERHYSAPMVVAIGPYHHGLPELQEMEEVKKAAAFHLCSHLGQSPEAVYEKVLAVASDAQSCYDSSALDGIKDADFASMMFYDACFLLVTIAAFTKSSWCAPSLVHRTITHVVAIDVFLLENQIPWVVLEALDIDKAVDICDFISRMGMRIQSRVDRQARPLHIENYRPPHLLGLFHFYQSGGQRTELGQTQPERKISLFWRTISRVKHFFRTLAGVMFLLRRRFRLARARRLDSVALGTSAIELAEIGVKLRPSKTAELKDIGLTKGLLFHELFLPPLNLNQATASWLLNMAAFEMCTQKRMSKSEYTVNSYLALFAMVMDREEDVQELRANHLILGGFNNQQLLDFFKSRFGSTFQGISYHRIIRDLEMYKKKWRVWITIHRFVYNNIKTIVTVLSIMSVLVAILKTLLSLKRH